jgi:hypothetical protein
VTLLNYKGDAIEYLRNVEKTNSIWDETGQRTHPIISSTSRRTRRRRRRIPHACELNAFATARHCSKRTEAERSPVSWNFEGLLRKDSSKLIQETFGKT